MVEGVKFATDLVSKAFAYLFYEDTIFATWATIIIILIVIFVMLRNLTNRNS